MIRRAYKSVLTEEDLVEIVVDYGSEYSQALDELENLLVKENDQDKSIAYVMSLMKNYSRPVEEKKLVEVYNKYLKPKLKIPSKKKTEGESIDRAQEDSFGTIDMNAAKKNNLYIARVQIGDEERIWEVTAVDEEEARKILKDNLRRYVDETDILSVKLDKEAALKKEAKSLLEKKLERVDGLKIESIKGTGMGYDVAVSYYEQSYTVYCDAYGYPFSISPANQELMDKIEHEIDKAGSKEQSLLNKQSEILITDDKFDVYLAFFNWFSKNAKLDSDGYAIDGGQISGVEVNHSKIVKVYVEDENMVKVKIFTFEFPVMVDTNKDVIDNLSKMKLVGEKVVKWENVEDKLTMRGFLNKQSYVAHVPGHLDSSGNKAEWVVKDHKTDKILKSYKTKEEAEAGLKNMQKFKHMNASLNKESILISKEDLDKRITDDMIENLKIDIDEEKNAIKIYKAHIEKAKELNLPHVADLLSHIVEEEEHHIKELNDQLKDINKPLTEEQMEEKRGAKPTPEEMTSVLEPIWNEAAELAQTKGVEEAKKFVVDHVNKSSIKEDVKNHINYIIEGINSAAKLVYTIGNMILKYKGLGVVKVESDLKKDASSYDQALAAAINRFFRQGYSWSEAEESLRSGWQDLTEEDIKRIYQELSNRVLEYQTLLSS